MNAVTKLPTRNELAATREHGVPAIVPDSIGAVQALSQIIANSGWAPRDMKQPETIAVAIMQGMEIGLKPMQALQSIAVINGRPSIWGDAAIGLVQGSGKCEYVKEWSEGDGDAMTAFCEAKRNDSGSIVTQRFSVEDAKLAGLWGKAGPWKQYPRRMLQMRARAFALRDAFADVLKGLSVSEETSDYQPMRDVTPQRSAPQRDLAAELAQQADESPVEDAQFEETRDEPQTQEPRQPEKVTFYSRRYNKRFDNFADKAATLVEKEANDLLAANDREGLLALRDMNGDLWALEEAATLRAMVDASIASLEGEAA